MFNKNLTGIKDIDLLILEYLSDDDLFNLSLINKCMYLICNNQNFWKKKLEKIGFNSSIFDKEMNNYKKIYIQINYFLNKYTLNICLEKASYLGNITLVKFFISKGCYELGYGLFGAAEGNHKNLIDFYMSKNIDWNAGICGASRGGHKDLVAFFIKKVGSDDIYWNSAVQYAAEGNHRELINYFISKIVDQQLWNHDRIWDRVIQGAAKGGHKDLIDLIIEKGKEENFTFDWSYGICGAAEGNHKKLINFFISKGSGNFQSKWNSGLVSAIKGGHKNLANFFLEKGANNFSVLSNAAIHGGHLDMIKFVKQLCDTKES